MLQECPRYSGEPLESCEGEAQYNFQGKTLSGGTRIMREGFATPHFRS